VLEDRRVLSTVFVVNSLEDNTLEDELITLREAIAAANSGDAPPGGEFNEIHFDPSLAGGTIRLARASSPFVVAANITIVGLGNDQLTINGDVNGDGTGNTRLFDVNAGATLSLSEITLTNGYASEGTYGGAIHTDGTLVLNDCVLSNHYASDDGGAIYASASSPLVTLTDCEVTDNTALGIGGGIRSLGGPLVIDGSIIRGNDAYSGGGIYSSGALQIINSSVVEENSAVHQGGGFWAGGELTVSDSNITDNTATWGGGGYARNDALAVLTNATFQQNTATTDGGAWFSQFRRPVQMTGCTFADNRAERYGGAASGLDSAEIRGTHFEGNTAGSSGGAIYSGGVLMISDSTFHANSAKFGGALHTEGTATLESSEFTENSAVLGGAVNNWKRPLVIGQSLFENNIASNAGGAVRSQSPGTYIDSTFRLNQAGQNGGAFYTYGDDFISTIEGCLIEQNQAATNGGAIWTEHRRLEIASTTIQDNSTHSSGGGVYVWDGSVTLTDSLVARNTAENSQGGGIWLQLSAELALANTTVSSNQAHAAGGGIYFHRNAKPATLVNATITDNRADRNGTTGQAGGGIYSAVGNVLLLNTLVAGNFQGTDTAGSDIEGQVDPASSHNLVGDATSAGGLVHGVNDNLVGVDPLLGPLEDNGGQSPTHALLPGSPAIGAGDNALALAPDGEPLWYDQRGYDLDRLVGLHVDLGAYEYQQPGGELHGRKWFDLNPDGDEAWGGSIVTNGSLEEGSSVSDRSWVWAGADRISGWQVLRMVERIGTAFSPAEGAHSVHLNRAGMAGAIAQTLMTEPGRRYRVQFAMAGAPGDPALKTLRVSAAGEYDDFTFDATGRTAEDMGWETKTWEFVAQDAVTVLMFESLTPGSAGPALDNVVVQPFGRDDVRIYLDTDGNGHFDAGEPLTFLRPDDPNTADVDETGTYRFIGLPDDAYLVREVLADGFQQVTPADPDWYEVTIADGQSIHDLDFRNRWAGRISGTKFVDLNNNGIRDRNPLPASSPTVMMVVDVSFSTRRQAGFSVPDMNGDGAANEVLDAQLFAMLALHQELIDLDWGDSAEVGIVVFGSEAVPLDMNPSSGDVQLFADPTADADGNGIRDVEQVLRSIRRGHTGTTKVRSDFEAALKVAIQSLATLPPEQPKSLFFVSDGLSNNPWFFADEVQQLDAMGVHRVAWGFGDICNVADLRRIDPFAEQLTSTEQVVERATGRSRSGAGDGAWLEPPLAGVTIYLDENNTGQRDWEDGNGNGAWDLGEGDRWTVTDEDGWYAFDNLPIGSYTVREIEPTGYVQTAPLNPDEHRIDLRSGPIAAGYDFGNRPTPGAIVGIKGLDTDFDGQFSPGERGQAGVTFYLDLNNNSGFDEGEPTAVTDADGQFVFANLTPGQYVVRELTPPGFEQIVPADGEGIVVNVEPGQTASDLLFVNQDLRGCIRGIKWLDSNEGNGIRDPGEPGLAGVRIYLDLNHNGHWDLGEPYTWTQEDDPDTPDVDETGWWEIRDVLPGTYTVREVSPAGYDPGYPGPDGHVVEVLTQKLHEGLLFGNIPLLPSLGGVKFDDRNENGQRDRNRLRGEQPLLVMTIDLSDSMQNSFAGDPPGDVNGDGFANTVLDGQLAALIEVNQALIDQGLGETMEVAIVVFGETAWALDMDTATPGVQLTTTPAADLNEDGILDVEQILRSLLQEDRTNYGAALQTVIDVIAQIDPPAGSANMLFLSDGEPNELNYAAQVAALRDMQVNLSAFGAGSDASLYTLRMIDPDADLFTSPADLVTKFLGAATFSGGLSNASSSGRATGEWLEPGLPGVIVYLDENNNGEWDWVDTNGNGSWDPGEVERWTVTDADGRYSFHGLEPGVYVVREIVPDGWRWVPPRIALDDDASLVAHLPFRGSPVDVITGMVADNTGATLDQGRFGLDETAYFFGGEQWMTLDHPDLPRDAAPRTLSAWVRSADGQGTGEIDAIVSWGDRISRGFFGIALRASDDAWLAYLHAPDLSSNVVADQDWHFLTLSYDGETVRIYVDGVRKSQGSRALVTGSGMLLMGTAPHFALTHTFHGALDDVRIYDRVLGDGEVAALHAWERTRSIVDNGYVVRVDHGDAISDLDFGNAENDWPSLVEGVQQIASLGSPGPLYDMSGDWMPIVGGDEDTSFPSTVVLARGYGNGRVVAFGDDGFFVQETPLDNGRFLKNVTDWLDLNDGRQVRYTTGHSEVIQDDRVAGLAASLAGDGYSINALPGEITAQSLAATSVLIVGNAWRDFTAQEIEAVRQYVESGGGLWLLGLGWSWVGYHPDLTMEDYPMMKLAAPYEVRWLSSGISDPTNNLNGLPIFHTFYPEVPSLFVPAAVATIRDIHEAYPVGLPAALEASALLQRVYTEAHRALWFPTSEFAEGHAKCQEVYDALVALVTDYPESYAKASAFDETLYPTATWVRERLWWTWRDCLPLAEAVVQQMTEVGQLSANYAAVLQKHGVIILDNLKLGAPQVDFIDRYLAAIPSALHNLRTIFSLEHMGVQPALIPLAGRPDAVNLGWTIGLGTQNQFPADVAPIWGDYFVLGTAHEINHVVDAFTIGWDSRPMHLRRSQLIADAGDEPMNYLRSMAPAGWFTAAPHEFFASISNQWFCDSAHTVRLGLTRFDAGYLHPINQALFFADVYSQGGDSTWFYQIDLDGNITRDAMALRRDEQGRIDQLQVGDDVYRFQLNDSDNVIAYSLVQVGGTRIDMTIVHEPSAIGDYGEVASLPVSADWVHEWQSFWVEIWVSTPEMTTVGVAEAMVDLQYHTDYLTAMEIVHGPAFNVNPSGTIDDTQGLVSGLGGRTALTDVGDEAYVLLARVKFSSTDGDQVPVDAAGRNIGPYDMELALASGQTELVDVGTVVPELVGSPDTELWAVVYDIEDSHQIDFGDFSFFAAAFGQTVGEPTPEAPYVWWADFDKSGRVDFGDLAFFAPNFGKTRAAVQAGEQTLVFASNFPDAWRNGADGAQADGGGEGDEQLAGGEGEAPSSGRRLAESDGRYHAPALRRQLAWAVDEAHATLQAEASQGFPWGITARNETQPAVPLWQESPGTLYSRSDEPEAASVERPNRPFDDWEPLEDLVSLLAVR
jgi:choice-of-anchor C domain-containing protein